MRSHRLVSLQLFAAAALWGCSCFQSVSEKQCDEQTPCGSGWRCVAGECVPPGAGGGGGGGFGGGEGSTCNATSCSGCCNGNLCVGLLNETNASCGLMGAACTACPAGSSCSFGKCTGATRCDSSTCSGCCQNGFCAPGDSQFACGTNGNLCASCSGSQVCSAGRCLLPPQSIGGPCQFNSDCAALGSGAYCKTITSTGNGLYSGGFCTKPCAADGGFGCTTNSLCLNALSPYGEHDVFCSPRCSNLAQCRTPGYACYFFVTAGANACWLNPIPSAGIDAGSSSTIGSACINDGQCLSPANSFCIPDVGPGIGATGFVGGYCSTSCNGTLCSSGSTCAFVISPVGTFPICLRDCSGPRLGQSTCRNGYVCDGVPGSMGGYCLPRCSNTGALCPTGTTCNQTSGYCS